MAARVEKLSVSLGAEEAAWAREQAEAAGSSLSAVLTEAVRRQRKLQAMDLLLAELGTDDITEEDLTAVRAEWRR
jgi:UDP-N-acetylglucosamine:LPS N-acetylglucosamine transferase